MLDTNIVARPSADLHLAKSIGRNTLFGILSNAVQIGTRLITVPVVIAHIGLGGYGIWAAVTATASYMRFGSAGIKSAFQKYVAEATGGGDYEKASQLLSTGSILMLFLSLAGLIPLAIYSRNLAAASGVPAEFLTAAAGSLTLLASTMAISNFGAAFEAIVMGGHRIDLTRTFNMLTTAGEAVAVVALLSMGYGLFAMAAVMAVSELVNLGCCYVASRRVVPEIRVSLRYFTPSAFRELFRFAFSYQFVNILEVLYNLLLPVTILKFFGTEIAGIYAVVFRLAGAAQMGPDAMILPLLSAGTMVLSSGSVEKMRRFVNKSFKLTLALSSAPLAFVAVFGAPMIMAWTGRGDPEFRIALPFVCLAGLFQCISRLQLILYRATGNALHDIIRQACRLGILFILAGAGALIGFYGVLAALAVTEGMGVIYMCFALATPLRFLRLRDLVSDALRLTTAGAIIIAAGLSASMVRVPWALAGREAAIMKVVAGTLGCAIAVWPALALTGSTSPDERRTIRSLFLAWKKAPALVTE